MAKISTIVMVLFLGYTSQAKAEFSMQLYGGNATTQNHNASVDLPDANITGTHQNLKFDSAPVIGGRAIYWIDRFNYLGFGVDVSRYYGPDQKNQVSETDLCVYGVECFESAEQIQKFNNKMTAYGLELLLRYPMFKSEKFNKGQFQPYIMAGPSMLVFTMTDTNNFIPAGQTSRYHASGITAGAGLMVYFTNHIGAFLEYRGSNFLVKDKFYNKRIVNSEMLGTTLGKATFNVNVAQAGITYSIN